MVVKPFTEVSNSTYRYRLFKKDVDEMDLTWHRDKENREVTAVGKTDWLFQFENELPISMNENIFIPKETYHRIIKGTGDLLIKIKML